MEKNVGKTDKRIRYILAIVFAVMALLVSPWFWIPAILSAVTAALGFCGLYKLFGINTCRIEQHQ